MSAIEYETVTMINGIKTDRGLFPELSDLDIENSLDDLILLDAIKKVAEEELLRRELIEILKKHDKEDKALNLLTSL